MKQTAAKPNVVWSYITWTEIETHLEFAGYFARHVSLGIKLHNGRSWPTWVSHFPTFPPLNDWRQIYGNIFLVHAGNTRGSPADEVERWKSMALGWEFTVCLVLSRQGEERVPRGQSEIGGKKRKAWDTSEAIVLLQIPAGFRVSLSLEGDNSDGLRTVRCGGWPLWSWGNLRDSPEHCMTWKLCESIYMHLRCLVTCFRTVNAETFFKQSQLDSTGYVA